MEKKNKTIFVAILFFTICIIGLCIYFVNKNKDLSTNDAIKFRNEYMNYNDKDYNNVYISDVNTVKYQSEEETLKMIESGKGIIYFGYPTSEACRTIVPILVELGIELKTNIYYLNIEDIRSEYKLEDKTLSKIKDGSKTYYKILNLLYNELENYYIDGYNTLEKRIFAPTVLAVNNGIIKGIYFDKDSESKKEYTQEELNKIKKELNILINNNNIEICSKVAC